MKIVVVVVSFTVFIWIMFTVTFQGLDPRKRSSWLYGVGGFLSGLALGAVISGDLIGSLNIGAIFAFMILFTGATMHWHKQKYEGMAKSYVKKYEKKEDASLFAKLVKILLGKYK